MDNAVAVVIQYWAHKVTLISVSVDISQTPAVTARPRIIKHDAHCDYHSQRMAG